MNKMEEYFKQKEALRQSADKLSSKIIEDFKETKEGETFIDQINKKLNTYKEIRFICKKTKIKPFYYCLLLILLFGFILVGYFDNYLTLILATIYPLFMTFKVLQILQCYEELDEQNQKSLKILLIHWLKYWIFYTMFLNFECFFGRFFKKFYFLFKIIFLFSCFPVNSRLTILIYNTWLGIVQKHEGSITKFCTNIYEHIAGIKKDIDPNKKKKTDGDYENDNLKDLIKEKGGKIAFNLLKNIY